MKKFRFRVTKKLILAVAVAVAAAAQAVSSAPPAADGPRTVRRVTDGDTLVLDTGEKVRLIGVDAPEVHDDQGRNATHARRHQRTEAVVDAYAEKARQFVAGQVEGRKVLLEYGPEKTDKYGRTLAFVHRDDGLFLNAEILRRGYGFAYTRFPFKYSDDFKRYEAEARRNREGLWK